MKRKTLQTLTSICLLLSFSLASVFADDEKPTKNKKSQGKAPTKLVDKSKTTKSGVMNTQAAQSADEIASSRTLQRLEYDANGNIKQPTTVTKPSPRTLKDTGKKAQAKVRAELKAKATTASKSKTTVINQPKTTAVTASKSKPSTYKSTAANNATKLKGKSNLPKLSDKAVTTRPGAKIQSRTLKRLNPADIAKANPDYKMRIAPPAKKLVVKAPKTTATTASKSKPKTKVKSKLTSKSGSPKTVKQPKGILKNGSGSGAPKKTVNFNSKVKAKQIPTNPTKSLVKSSPTKLKLAPKSGLGTKTKIAGGVGAAMTVAGGVGIAKGLGANAKNDLAAVKSGEMTKTNFAKKSAANLAEGGAALYKLKKLSPTNMLLGDAIGTDPLDLAVNGIGDLLNGTDNAKQSIAGIKDAWNDSLTKQAFTDPKAAAKRAGKDVVNTLENVGQKVGQGIENVRDSKVGQGVKNGFQNTTQFVDNHAQKFKNTVGNAGENVGQGVKNGFQNTTQFVDNHAQKFKNTVGNAGENVGQGVKNGFQNTTQFVDNHAQKFKNTVGKAGNNVKKNLLSAGDSAKQKVASVGNGIKETGNKAKKFVGSLFKKKK